MTSRMLGLSVSSMTRRSMPMPMPPVGGMPYSRAVRKSSSSTTYSKIKARRSRRGGARLGARGKGRRNTIC